MNSGKDSDTPESENTSHLITKETPVPHSHHSKPTQKQYFWVNIIYIVVIFSTITGIVVYASNK